MTNNSFIILDEELQEFKDKSLFRDNYMHRQDISWVAQVRPFIDQFSDVGDYVYDPFAGLGTTLLGAGSIGRRGISIELNKERFALLQTRLEHHKDRMKANLSINCDNALSANYPTDIDLIVTNPPYFHVDTSLENENLYSIDDYDQYLKMMEEVFIKCQASLKKDGYIIVFSENIKLPNGNMIPQAYDLCKILQKYFLLKDERIVLYKKDEKNIDDPSITNRAHEYAFILKKKSGRSNLSEYYKLLKQIDSNNIPYTTIGSFALFNREEAKAMDNYPADLDLLVPFDIQVLNDLANLLRSDGYNLFLWDQPLAEINIDILKGKYYIRALKGDYCIDINYESDVLDFQTTNKNSEQRNGIRVASLHDILALMKNRNNKTDKALTYRINELKRQNK